MTITDVRDLVERLIADSSKLGVRVDKRDKTYLIDCGVRARPGFLVGKIVSAISMAGLAEVDIYPSFEQSLPFPCLKVVTDNPVSACLCSQAAVWVLKSGNYVCYISGPGRAMLNKPRSFMERFNNFSDQVDKDPIFIIECLPVDYPPNDVIDKISNLVGNDRTYIITISALSPAGIVQICSRVIEVALMRMLERPELKNIISAIGSCLIPPLKDDVYLNIAACNDCIRFTGQVSLTFNGRLGDIDNVLRSVVTDDQAPSFLELVRQYGPEFLTKTPLEMFTIAELIVSSGSITRRSGRKHIDRVLEYMKIIR